MKRAWWMMVVVFELTEFLIGLMAAIVVAVVMPVVSFVFWLGALLSPPMDRTVSALLLFCVFALSTFAAYFTVLFLSEAMQPMQLSESNLSPEESEPAIFDLPWGVRLGEEVFSLHWLAVVPMIVPWLVYYLLAGAAALFVTRWIELAADRPHKIVAVVWGALLSFAFSVAMHSYLIMALAGLFRSRAVVRAVWKWRFVIDVVQTAAVLWVLERAR